MDGRYTGRRTCMFGTRLVIAEAVKTGPCDIDVSPSSDSPLPRRLNATFAPAQAARLLAPMPPTPIAATFSRSLAEGAPEPPRTCRGMSVRIAAAGEPLSKSPRLTGCCLPA
jgi:hypothetical protein